MKSHVVFRGCSVRHERKGLKLSVWEAEMVEGKRGTGADLNSELINGPLGEEFRDFLADEEDERIFPVGDLYVGVGALPVISSTPSEPSPLSLIDLGEVTKNVNPYERVTNRFWEPTKMAIAVIRDWLAPRTHGWIDGGAAGVFENLFPCPLEEIRRIGDPMPRVREALERCILKEMAEEIGILAKDQNGETGWVGFSGFDHPSDEPIKWLNDITREAWTVKGVTHPGPMTHAQIDIGYAPDEVVIERVPASYYPHEFAFGTGLSKVALAFELEENATVEIERAIDVRLDPQFTYTFIDREKFDGQYLDGGRGRMISVICLDSNGRAFTIFFDEGSFAKKVPGIRITGEFLDGSTSDKFRKLFSVIIS